MRLIDADFIISILDEAEQEYPEHKPIYACSPEILHFPKRGFNSSISVS